MGSSGAGILKKLIGRCGLVDTFEAKIVMKYLGHHILYILLFDKSLILGWVAHGESVAFMTCLLLIGYRIEVNFLSSIFLPLISAETCEKSSWWLWKECCVSTGVRKPGNTFAYTTAIIRHKLLTLSQTSPGFYVSAGKVF